MALPPPPSMCQKCTSHHHHMTLPHHGSTSTIITFPNVQETVSDEGSLAGDHKTTHLKLRAKVTLCFTFVTTLDTCLQLAETALDTAVKTALYRKTMPADVKQIYLSEVVSLAATSIICIYCDCPRVEEKLLPKPCFKTQTYPKTTHKIQQRV